MTHYLLVLKQSGGCDYTIGCGVKVLDIYADDLEDAQQQTEETIAARGGYGNRETRIDSAVLYKVEKSSIHDLNGVRARRKAEREAEEAREKEEAEKAELERLKAKYGG